MKNQSTHQTPSQISTKDVEFLNFSAVRSHALPRPPWHRVGATKFTIQLNVKADRPQQSSDVAVNTFDLQYA